MQMLNAQRDRCALCLRLQRILSLLKLEAVAFSLLIKRADHTKQIANLQIADRRIKPVSAHQISECEERKNAPQDAHVTEQCITTKKVR